MKQWEDLQLSSFIKRGWTIFSVTIYSSKRTCARVKKEIKFSNKLSMQVNLLVGFHREKYNL